MVLTRHSQPASMGARIQEKIWRADSKHCTKQRKKCNMYIKPDRELKWAQRFKAGRARVTNERRVVALIRGKLRIGLAQGGGNHGYLLWLYTVSVRFPNKQAVQTLLREQSKTRRSSLNDIRSSSPGRVCGRLGQKLFVFFFIRINKDVSKYSLFLIFLVGKSIRAVSHTSQKECKVNVSYPGRRSLHHRLGESDGRYIELKL